MYCRVSKNGKVHVVYAGRISYEYHAKGYAYPLCGLTCGLIIDATEEEYKNNGCKGCKKALFSRTISKMRYGT